MLNTKISQDFMSARIGIIFGHLCFVLIRTFQRIKWSNKGRRPPYWIADVARARFPPWFEKNGKDWAETPKRSRTSDRVVRTILRTVSKIRWNRGTFFSFIFTSYKTREIAKGRELKPWIFQLLVVASCPSEKLVRHSSYTEEKHWSLQALTEEMKCNLI